MISVKYFCITENVLLLIPVLTPSAKLLGGNCGIILPYFIDK